MKVDGHIEGLRRLENDPIFLFVEKASMSMAVDHCAFEAQLRDTTFQFLCRFAGVRSWQCSKGSEPGRVGAHRIVRAIIGVACHRNRNVCGEGLGSRRSERQDLNIDAGRVHIPQPRRCRYPHSARRYRGQSACCGRKGKNFGIRSPRPFPGTSA